MSYNLDINWRASGMVGLTITRHSSDGDNNDLFEWPFCVVQVNNNLNGAAHMQLYITHNWICKWMAEYTKLICFV